MSVDNTEDGKYNDKEKKLPANKLIQRSLEQKRLSEFYACLKFKELLSERQISRTQIVKKTPLLLVTLRIHKVLSKQIRL